MTPSVGFHIRSWQRLDCRPWQFENKFIINRRIMAEHFLQWVRSLIFVVQMYLFMGLLALFYLPMAVIDREWAFRGMVVYCHWVRKSARWLVGLNSEIRGEIPKGDVLICSKHQSFFDVLLMCSVLPRPRFVMKRQLIRIPIVGYFATRIGCIPVDRGRGSLAVRQMMKGLEPSDQEPSQLIIFPQGTRVAPGTDRPYKIGAAVLYGSIGNGCIPAATNVGVFWPRKGVFRKPGLAVVEFLPQIGDGMSQDTFMQTLERTIEQNSNRLMHEAGFDTGQT